VDSQSKTLMSCWKSAMQKFIRRGMVGEAMYAAERLGELNPGGLRNRLLVIVMTDAWARADLIPKSYNPYS